MTGIGIESRLESFEKCKIQDETFELSASPHHRGELNEHPVDSNQRNLESP